MREYRFVPAGSTHTVRLFIDDAAQLELEVGFMTYQEAEAFAEMSGRSNIISSTGEVGETRLVSDMIVYCGAASSGRVVRSVRAED